MVIVNLLLVGTVVLVILIAQAENAVTVLVFTDKTVSNHQLVALLAAVNVVMDVVVVNLRHVVVVLAMTQTPAAVVVMEIVPLAPAVVQMEMVLLVVVVVLVLLTPAKTTVLAGLVCNVM